MGTSAFDAIADDFDRFRALPLGVPAGIRDAVWDTLGGNRGGRLLDLGAGTGRIGEAFVAAGDAYVALDRSMGMLARFARKAASRGDLVPPLVQADGRRLPFSEAAFETVLVVQVLSGSPGWHRMMNEVLRVLRPGGAVVLGEAIAPPDGLDAQMREQLSQILAERGVEVHRAGRQRASARDWLASRTKRIHEVIAARWEVSRSPREFLARHATGARFATLPEPIRADALRLLGDWAVAAFGTLDAGRTEQHAFLLDVCIV
jgi:ubiquinone/menaquinone biosynthesis C-methylase UbiE